MFCTVCAAPNPIAARSCHGCGTGLARQARAGAAGRSRRRTVALALYGAPLLVLLLAGTGYYRAAWTEPAAWYERAAAAEAAGRYPEALDAYAAAAGYQDADARRAAVAAALAPHRAAYEAAVEALDAGRHDQAIALLAPAVRALPGYEEAALLLGDARRRRADELRRRAGEAEARRDWLEAERSLAALAAADPGDEALAERLTAVRRHHAPLVFARDRALYLIGPDGGDETVLVDAVPAAWPAWSPDRGRVAFTSPEEGGEIALYVVDADGENLTRLAGELRPYSGPTWSPDGTRIAYAAQGDGRERPGQTEPDPPGIRVVEVATGRVTNVSGGRVREGLYPTWSPTGDRLAFVSRDADAGFTFDPPPPGAGTQAPPGEVYVATLATGEIANLSGGRVLHPWRVAWSPADDRLLVYTRDPGMSYDRDYARLVLLDARSGDLTEVPTDGERITMPVWSPDGTRIAYVAGEQTVVVRPLGGGARRIDLDAAVSRFLAWSPDGTALVAVAEGADRPSFVVSLADPALPPAPLRLDHDTDRRNAGAPQWSPPRPAEVPGPPTVAGTALDPEKPPPADGRDASPAFDGGDVAVGTGVP